MVKDILLIVVGIAGIFAFNYIRSKIINKGKTILSDNIPAIKKIEEEFNASKLKEGLTNLTNKVGWAKTLTQEFSLRTWIARIGIGLVILSAIYAYGVWKGKQGIQPVLSLVGKEEWISINSHYLHIKKEGTLEVVDKDKKTVLKKITVRDLTNLRQNLKPFGVTFKPYFSFGVITTNKGIKQDMGLGVNFFKYYNYWLGGDLSNNGINIGITYKFTENFGVNGSVGKGYKGDNLFSLRGQWGF